MANQEPIARPAQAADDAPVIVIPETGQEAYENLKKSYLNRLTVYITMERPNSKRTGISWFFSKSRDNTNVTKKDNDVKELKSLINNWQPSNAESTKNFLMQLSLKADEAQKGVFMPKFMVKSNLAKAIDDVKSMVWNYLITQKIKVKDELFAQREKSLKDLERADIKTSAPDDKYNIPGANTNRFKNKGEQLEYEAEHLYPDTAEANKALYDAQKASHKIIP